jgi:putative ABC transport system permease protein
MKHTLYLAWNYLKYYRVKTLLLLLAISLTFFIPMALEQLSQQGSKKLRARAVATPLLLGNKGSATELCLNSLYFRESGLEPIPFRSLKDLRETGLARAIPLHLEYRVKDQPIVGTSQEYFSFRGLTFSGGRPMAVLGECVLGARAARNLKAEVGSSVISTPAGAFDIAGSFPLKMTVAGILNPGHTPDDDAVFTDIKTTWVISGKAHGHQDVGEQTADSLLLSRSASEAVASPALLSYTEITPENIGSFHFHGNPDSYPINAVIAVPGDKKTELMLRGRYQDHPAFQMVVPEDVVDELIGTVVSVKDLLLLAALSVGLATMLITALVFLLSIQLRKAEISTMKQIGASPALVRGTLITEILLILATGILISLILVWSLSNLGIPLLENYLY